MTAHSLPHKRSDLFTLALCMAAGQHTYQIVLGLKRHLEAAMRALLGDAQAAEKNYRDGVTVEGAGSAALALADTQLKAFITSARKLLATYLGEKWSDAWVATGFPNQSTSVPSTQAARHTLVQALQGYFTDHAEWENPAPEVNVTAARAGALDAAMKSALESFQSLQGQTLTLKLARDGAEKALRVEMSALIRELGESMADNDPRWLDFGLALPGAHPVPEQVVQLILEPGGPGEAHADWADTPRHTGYHVELLIVGVDTEFRRVLTRKNSDARLTGLPSTKTVKVRVLAYNSAGEGIPSEEKEIVVP